MQNNKWQANACRIMIPIPERLSPARVWARCRRARTPAGSAPHIMCIYIYIYIERERERDR